MRSLASIEEEAIQWLWYPYFPYGNITLVFGRGGIGKSHIALDMAARVSTGTPAPSHGELNDARPPQRVLLLAAEDDAATIIKPRLLKLGADMDNIFVPEEYFDLSPRGMVDLAAYVAELEPALIIIDPLVSYLGGRVDMHKANEVRVFMGGLMEIAKANGIAILLIHHKKKGDVQDDNDAADLAMGSADFNNAVRSSVFVRHGNTGQTIMQHVKHNYSPKGPNMVFSIDPVFTWEGEPAAMGRPALIRTNAKEFLLNALKNGPVPARDIERAAADAGIAPRTLARAKVGVAESFLVLGPEPGDKQWFWRVVGDRRGTGGVPMGPPDEALRPTGGAGVGTFAGASSPAGGDGSAAPGAGDRRGVGGEAGDIGPAEHRSGALVPEAGEPASRLAGEVARRAIGPADGETDIPRVAGGGEASLPPTGATGPGAAAQHRRPLQPGEGQGASSPVRGVGPSGSGGVPPSDQAARLAAVRAKLAARSA